MRSKLLFVIPSMAGGGAERVLLLLLRHLDRHRYDPVVVTFEARNDYPAAFSADTRVICLNKKGRLDFFRLVVDLSKEIARESPALICSFLTYANYLTALAAIMARTRAPVIVTEHNFLTQLQRSARYRAIKSLLIRTLYHKAHSLIAVSEGVKDDLARHYSVPKSKCIVIHNPVDIEEVRSMMKEPTEHRWFRSEVPIIVACARLTKAKNHPMLLRAIQRVIATVPVRLLVLGEGEERKSLEAYAEMLGISSHVAYCGFQENPFTFIAHARIFVLSSSWEGFGNVIIEAMACGVPVISTDCDHGPREIITHGVDGLLVPVDNDGQLASSILTVLHDDGLRESLAKAGVTRAERFRVDGIVREYEAVFDSAIAAQGRM